MVRPAVFNRIIERIGTDHDARGIGLRKAIYNYMHGLCVEDDVRRWFDHLPCPVPRPTVKRGKIGKALAEEVKSKGAHMLLAPTVNIHRSVTNGRNFECYSEDPYLTAELAVGYIQGLQGQGGAVVPAHPARQQGHQHERQQHGCQAQRGA